MPRSEDPKFPVRYYQHPATGVVVEVDPEGLCSLTPLVGDFRPFKEMKESQFTAKRIWNATDEIKTLLNHGWKLV